MFSTVILICLSVTVIQNRYNVDYNINVFVAFVKILKGITMISFLKKNTSIDYFCSYEQKLFKQSDVDHIHTHTRTNIAIIVFRIVCFALSLTFCVSSRKC